MPAPNFNFENSTNKITAGVDEAGRGPWAGPVVAAAVILDRNNLIAGINDSKKLTAQKRNILYAHIIENCQFGVGMASIEEIDNLNILQASMLAMQRAISALPQMPELALIDGNKTPALPCESIAIIKGDSKSLSIAAASIIAKVTRDKIMADLSIKFPYYGWEQNSGYGTKLHSSGIQKHGISPHHRLSFKPIRNHLLVS